MEAYVRRFLGEGITMVIGRGEDCDLRVDDDYLSLHHALIHRKPNGTYWIADLATTNGTRIVRSGSLLGMRVDLPMPLLPGDVICVGRQRIPWTPPT